MKSSPKLAKFLAVPARKPSPNPTRSSREPTPHAIPNIVRKERSLCVHMARNTSPKLRANRFMTEVTNIRLTKFLFTRDVLTSCLDLERQAGLKEPQNKASPPWLRPRDDRHHGSA